VAFIGEVHGHDKQGAGFGYTGERGYHPLLASRSGTGEALHVRLRKGQAGSGRGGLRFVQELIARVGRAGAKGEILIRADSAFWNKKVLAYLAEKGCRYSIGVTMHKVVAERIAQIPEEAWQPVADYPDTGSASSPRPLWETSGWSSAGCTFTLRRSRPSCLPTGVAHNLARWTGMLGLKGPTPRTARTIRRWLLAIPGRLTGTARRWTLHLPARWPWQRSFIEALTRIRALPAAA
jgi:DDE family transposase